MSNSCPFVISKEHILCSNYCALYYINETQAGEVFGAENAQVASAVASAQEDSSIIGQASADSDATPLTGKRTVTASFGVYLQIAD